jgi:hypothetical protein
MNSHSVSLTVRYSSWHLAGGRRAETRISERERERGRPEQTSRAVCIALHCIAIMRRMAWHGMACALSSVALKRGRGEGARLECLACMFSCTSVGDPAGVHVGVSNRGDEVRHCREGHDETNDDM